MSDIAEKISKVFVSKLYVHPNQVTPAASLADLAVTKFDLIQTYSALEHQFGIEITDRDVVSLHTVEDVVMLIRRKLH